MINRPFQLVALQTLETVVATVGHVVELEPLHVYQVAVQQGIQDQCPHHAEAAHWKSESLDFDAKKRTSARKSSGRASKNVGSIESVPVALLGS